MYRDTDQNRTYDKKIIFLIKIKEVVYFIYFVK